MNDCCARSLWHNDWHLAVVQNAESGLIAKSVTLTGLQVCGAANTKLQAHTSCVVCHHADDVSGLNDESKQCSQTLAEQAYPQSCQLSNSSLDVYFLRHCKTMCACSGEQQQQLVMVQKQVNKFRWKRKAEKRKRRLHQVFLRGDNIVTVTPVLRDVERDWSQLVYQWRAAGFLDAAVVTPASLAAAAGALPPPPPLLFPPQRLSPTAVQMLPPWAGDRR